ncbi:MAG: prepilin peptidase [bacterium]|nr:prepilin peptidase [bacterium]
MGFLFFILGLFFGSFANVCIYRLPKGKSIVYPNSFCPYCNKSIKWYDNIPILSYIFLKGRCRNCKKPISPRYFIVELLTGILFFAIYKRFGLTISTIIYNFLILCLIIVSFIDIETFLISDIIVIPGIIIGLLLSFLFPGIHNMDHINGFLYSLKGTILGGGILIFLGFIGKLLFKKEAMGGGDVKLLGMVGAFLGWKCVIITLLIASFAGVIFNIPLMIIRKKNFGDLIPFGPYLAIGTIVSIFLKGRYISYFFVESIKIFIN